MKKKILFSIIGLYSVGVIIGLVTGFYYIFINPTDSNNVEASNNEKGVAVTATPKPTKKPTEKPTATPKPTSTQTPIPTEPPIENYTYGDELPEAIVQEAFDRIMNVISKKYSDIYNIKFHEYSLTWESRGMEYSLTYDIKVGKYFGNMLKSEDTYTCIYECTYNDGIVVLKGLSVY